MFFFSFRFPFFFISFLFFPNNMQLTQLIWLSQVKLSYHWIFLYHHCNNNHHLHHLALIKIYSFIIYSFIDFQAFIFFSSSFFLVLMPINFKSLKKISCSCLCLYTNFAIYLYLCLLFCVLCVWVCLNWFCGF